MQKLLLLLFVTAIRERKQSENYSKNPLYLLTAPAQGAEKNQTVYIDVVRTVDDWMAKWFWLRKFIML